MHRNAYKAVMHLRNSMGKYLIVPLALLANIACASQNLWSPTPESADLAARFITELAKKSPAHDGIPLRKYEIKDIDNDGSFEVVVYSSELEERAVGYLSVASSPPTYRATIYSVKNGRFREDTRSFKWFLTKQKIFYEQWLEYFQIKPPEEKEVVQEIEKNIKRVEQLLK